jgi:hypothetical protein
MPGLDSNTKLLCHFDSNDRAVNYAPPNSITVASFNGTTALITTPDSADWDIVGSASENWTIDLWVKHTDHAGIEIYVSQYEDVNNQWNFFHNHGTGLYFLVTSGGSTVITLTAGEIVDSGWHHVAMCKVADKFGLYKDGVQTAYVQDSSIDTFGGSLSIGAKNEGSGPFDGQMDEVRIQKSNLFNAAPVECFTGVFNGTTSQLSIPDHADWDLVGSSSDDWTIDLWAKHADHVGNEKYFTQYEDANNLWTFGHLHGTGLFFQILTGGSIVIDATGGGEIADTNWHHIALCKVGSLYGIYKDGVQVAFTDDSTTDTFAGLLYIGSSQSGTYLEGCLDEVRVQKSNAFGALPNVGLTNTIAVPTSNHVPDANTKLLLHFNNNTTDNGNTGHTVTNTGVTFLGNSPLASPNRIYVPAAAGIPNADTKLLLRFQNNYRDQTGLHTMTAANTTFVNEPYSFPVAGAIYHAKFHGVKSYLSAPDHADWDVVGSSSDDWTIDLWVRHIEHVGTEVYFRQYEDTNNSWDFYHAHGTGIVFEIKTGGSITLTLSGGEIADAYWHHAALCKVGSVYGIYKDGTQVAYVSDTSTDTFAGLLYIATNGASAGYLNGEMLEVRIVKSNAFSASPNVGLTNTIIIPVRQHISDSNTKLLLHFNKDFMDSGATGHVVTNSVTTLHTTVSFRSNSTYPKATMHLVADIYKYNKASFLFDGNSDYYELNDNAAWDIVATTVNNATIECWVRFSVTNTNITLVIQDDNLGNNLWTLQYLGSSGTGFRFYSVVASAVKHNVAEGANSISANVWYHIAFVKVGSVYGIYKNGVQLAYQSTANVAAFNQRLLVGAYPAGAQWHNGYMDDVHITYKNKYDALPNASLADTITIPKTKLSSDEGTVLLLQGFDKEDSSDWLNAGAAHNPTFGAGTSGYNNNIPVFGNAAFYSAATANDYITFPDSDDWDICANTTDNWTVDVWIYTTTVGATTSFIVGQYEDVNNWWGLFRTTAALGFTLQSGGATVVTLPNSGTLLVNKWHHVALVKVADKYAIYLNGTQISYVQDTSIDTFTGLLHVGMKSSGTSHWSGYQEELRIQKSNYFGANPVVGLTDVIAVPYLPYRGPMKKTQALTLI